MKESKEGLDWFPLFQRGDKHAFKQAFDLHYRSILYFASTILQQDSYAEDIASQTFVKAWDRHSQFESPRHLENFLYLVTRNACISHLRSGRVSQHTEQEWDRLSAVTEEQEMPIDLERVQTQLIEQLYRQLESLSGGDILRMSYLEGKSTEEIARELNMTENNVYVIKSRSLKLLRQRLGREGLHLFILLLLFQR